MYKEYSPSPFLAPYIDKYWEFKGSVTKGMHFDILPDGCTDFIFTLGEVANVCGDTLVMQPYRSYFVGAMTTYSHLTAQSDTIDMFGIRFRPCGVCHFARLPLPELTDKRIHTSDLGSLFQDSFADILAEKNTVQARIGLIENYLSGHLRRFSSPVDPGILYAVRQINRHHGKQPIPLLAEQTNMCQRHFERKFKRYTGYTPKEYSRIMQFRKAVDLLRNPAFDNLLSVAVDAGYYDVSHLSREIKKIAGNTPVSFLSAPEPEEVSLTYLNS